MIKYVAFLRGINVSGQKIIKMDALKEMLTLPGFKNVRTYIQSGNVLFQTNEADPNILIQKIEKKLLKDLGYSVSVVIRTLDEINEVISNNPFTNLAEDDNRKISVTFLSALPEQEKANNLPKKTEENDELHIRNKEIYLLYVSYGESKLSNSFFEKKLALTATTRNWATINKIAALLQQ